MTGYYETGECMDCGREIAESQDTCIDCLTAIEEDRLFYAKANNQKFRSDLPWVENYDPPVSKENQ